MLIVHVFRAPVGGLFRHVIDLAKEQAARGHQVGVFCDETFAGERNERLLEDLKGHLALGLVRVPMQRNPHWTDITALRRLSAFARSSGAEVLHGHGSKGGLYARLSATIGGKGQIRAYTPHGGSLNYKPGSMIHRAYMAIEGWLERGTDVFLFESRFVADRFREYVGETTALTRVVLNGLYAHEMEPVSPVRDPTDFLYIGEFRFAKGVDNLLDAISWVAATSGRTPTLTLVGQGPDEAALRARAETLGLTPFVTFHKPMAAREAFSLARAMIVPSRFESMPYVVIEAAGASIPLISTNVGGIPEIFGPEGDRLIPSDDVAALASAITAMMKMSDGDRQADASRLANHIARDFCVMKMATTVLDAYRAAAERRNAPISAAVAQAPAE